MRIGLIYTVIEDGKFSPWEKLLEWDSYLDFYALALGRMGHEVIKYVPSRVGKISEHRHRLGHVFKRVPEASFNQEILSDAKTEQIDVLHYGSYFSRYFVRSSKLSKMMPTVAQWTGGFLPDGALKRRVWKAAIRHGLRGCKKVLMGPYPKATGELYELIGSASERIDGFEAPVVDLERFKPMDKREAQASLGWKPSRLHLLMVCYACRPEKRFGKRPSAVLPLVKRMGEKVELHAAVTGPGVGMMMTEANRLGINDRIIWMLGGRDNRKLPPYYAAADLIINPYEFDRLNQGSVTAEAWACGRPVMGLKSKDAREEQPGGFLVDGSSSFEDRLQGSYLEDKGKEGLQMRGRFSLETCGRNLDRIYRQAAA